MKVEVKPGKYVLAVSGGVDSMVLLDLLAKKPEVELVVAHFDHGIRADSHLDEQLVAHKAKQLNLTFEVGYGHLGSGTSEEKARHARYLFLENAAKKHKAAAVITAHHQDDLIETAFINLLRGTGRRGLVAISANRKVVRPLLGCPKKEILKYAAQNGIEWREDSSNSDGRYLRNYVRKNLVADLNAHQRTIILENTEKVAQTDTIINHHIANLSQYVLKDEHIDRNAFVALPVNLSEELLVYWLRQKQVLDFDKKTINRLSIAIRTSKADAVCPVNGELKLVISQKSAEFSHNP